MRLRRTGTYRSRGIDMLARTNTFLSTKWEGGADTLNVWVRGVEGATTHRYGIEFTGSELADLVETAIVQATADQASHATAKGIAAYIRAILTTPLPKRINLDPDED